ncbi:PrgI family protein [Candidatus Parcubacteria bacterium]|nr:MAG: PrgI family protein [Candidatus Parcubacteria bacterium]
MQFQVPQFIEVEDKIFGPLTFKQFIYIAGGAGAAYLLWRALPIFVAAPLILSMGGLAAALAFFQYNGRPFILAIEHAFFYFIKTKLYLWSNESKPKKSVVETPIQVTSASNIYVPKLSESKLHELAWSLDIKERIAAGVASEQEHEGGVVAPIRTAREARI